MKKHFLDPTNGAPCELNERGQQALGWGPRQGHIVGESRNKKCWWVIWNGQKTRSSFSKDFILVIVGSE